MENLEPPTPGRCMMGNSIRAHNRPFTPERYQVLWLCV